MPLRTTMGRAVAAAALAVLAACSSAQAADRPEAAPAAPDLPGSATLAATAADRAETLCERGADGLESSPASYDDETWAEVVELVGRARLGDDEDPTAARAAALDEVRAGWQGDGALERSGWDHAETATATCPDGHLSVVEVLARTPTPSDAGDHRRPRQPVAAIEQRLAIPYRTVPDVTGQDVDLLLDLYLPPPRPTDGAGRPTLVLVHGGGFAAGSRSWHTEDAIAYARQGFVVANIDYRVDPAASDSASAQRAAGFAALDDGMEAIRWLRARADSLGIDLDRIAALGASAGGEIALGLALLDDLTVDGPYAGVSSQVTAAFSTGAYLTPVLGAASLEADDAPVLLHFFETDTVSRRPWTFAAGTCDAVRAAGSTCDLIVSEAEGHVIGLGPSSAEADRILSFLAVHLRLGR